jgi:Na+-driven multidrug efflux pump
VLVVFRHQGAHKPYWFGWDIAAALNFDLNKRFFWMSLPLIMQYGLQNWANTFFQMLMSNSSCQLAAAYGATGAFTNTGGSVSTAICATPLQRLHGSSNRVIRCHIAVCFQSSVMCGLVDIATDVAVSVRVGIRLGNNEPAKARYVAALGVGIATIAGAIISFIIFLLRKPLSDWFAPAGDDGPVHKYTMETVPVVAIYYFLNS